MRPHSRPEYENQKSGIVEKLKVKHKVRLARAEKTLKNEYARGRRKKGSEIYDADIYLFQKWAYRVGKGWYGFSLGDIPRVWTDVLDDFLSWLETQCPDFEIHQIKMKIGGLKFYAGTKTHLLIPDENICSEIFKLEALLRHENLIR
jgi:hypothetical protein